MLPNVQNHRNQDTVADENGEVGLLDSRGLGSTVGSVPSSPSSLSPPSYLSPPRKNRSRWLKPMGTASGTLALVGLIYFASTDHGQDHKLSRPPSPAEGIGNGMGKGEIVVRATTIADPSRSAGRERAFTGTLQARYRTDLGFRVGGKIVARHVETGQRVSAGALLMQLDKTDAQMQLEVSRADLVAAEAQVLQIDAEERRLASLLGSRSVSQSDYDLALAARNVARARLEGSKQRLLLAQNQWSYCDLLADADGLITQIPAEVGQVVTPGQTVLTWVQGDELEAVVALPESLISEVVEHSATVRLWSRPDCRVSARLREVSPIADPVSRTFEARFTLVDPPAGLALGMTATVHLESADDPSIPVPMAAIAGSPGRPHVWKIDPQGGIVSVPIDILRYESRQALVRGDLRAGDRIVSAGVQRLNPADRVRVWQDGYTE